MKVFLYGRRGAGKSTIIKKLLGELALEASGFCTVRGPADAEGKNGFYIIGADNGNIDAHSMIGCSFPDGRWESFSEAFDSYGVKLLTFSERPPEIIVMDELGFMEARAAKFQSRVLEILGEDIPVIGVVKLMPEPFLQSVISHPSVKTIEVTEENRDSVLTELKEIFNRDRGGA